jgi:hypothetical protein
LRSRGLSLNASKSQIINAEEADRRFNAAIPVIEEVRHDMVEMITAALGGSYVSRTEAESVLDKPIDEISVELIEHTFDLYFINESQTVKRFSPTLFHFLINRLAAAKSGHGVDYCLGLFKDHPEETANILEYVGKVKDFRELDDAIAELLESPETDLYPYQAYQVFYWLSDLGVELSSHLVAIVRAYAFDGGRPQFVRSVCLKLLGKFGTNSDLERLEHEYSHAAGSLEQGDIICAVERIETGRRNAFLGRVENDNDWTRRAVTFVKSR